MGWHRCLPTPNDQLIGLSQAVLRRLHRIFFSLHKVQAPCLRGFHCFSVVEGGQLGTVCGEGIVCDVLVGVTAPVSILRQNFSEHHLPQ